MTLPGIGESIIALQFSSTALVLRDGREERLSLQRFPFDPPAFRREIAFRDGVCLLRLDSLSDAADISGLLLQNAREIRQCRGLIVDLRKCSSCCGDCDALLPLLTDSAAPRSAIMPQEEIYMLYSPGNNRLLRGEIESLLPQAQNAEERGVLEAALQDIQDKTGWVSEPIIDEEDPAIPPVSCKQLVVLSDRETGSDAERFIEAVRRLGRGTVVGRNTLGALDYVRPLIRPLDSALTLVYSCGMRAEAYHGRKINGVGLAPDIHIPWSPAFLTEDPDIETALRLIQK